MRAFSARIRRSYDHHLAALANLGLRGWLTFETQMRSRRLARLAGYRLRAKSLQSALFYRPGGSDIEAFLQVFVRQEYDNIGELDPSGIILDCGANVGYTTAWLLARYPDAHVIAVEPDPGNFRMLQRNLSQFGSSVTLIHGAVWPQDCGLALDRAAFRDGLSWSARVREASDGEPSEVQGFSIESLLDERPRSRISLLKMDVEGSEARIFSEHTEWVRRCDNIAIELHDEHCAQVFFAAVANEGFTVLTDGELTFCRREEVAQGSQQETSR